MNKKYLISVGKHMSKLLRHDSEDLDIDLNGYVKVKDLCLKKEISKESLDWIISTNDKKRFSYNEDQTLVRANQGHNKKMNVKIKMSECKDIEFLYHGTSLENLESIKEKGLKSMDRQHVHLSKDLETATIVAKRHSKNIIILKVLVSKMMLDGLKVCISDNNVYLTDHIDPIYISYD